jgi:hypothetical protein
MNSKRSILLAGLATASLFIYGRSWFWSADNGGRIGLRGTVSLNGEPVESGLIQFTPDRSTPGPVTSGAIAKGRYKIAVDEGVRPGVYEATVIVGARDGMIDDKLSLSQRPATSSSTRFTPMPFAPRPRPMKWPIPTVIAAGKRDVELNFEFPADSE